jgi:hypothetical protein
MPYIYLQTFPKYYSFEVTNYKLHLTLKDAAYQLWLNKIVTHGHLFECEVLQEYPNINTCVIGNLKECTFIAPYNPNTPPYEKPDFETYWRDLTYPKINKLDLIMDEE